MGKGDKREITARMWPICCDPGLRAGVRGLIPLQPRAGDAECPGSTGRSAECRATCSSNYRSAIKKNPIIRFPKGFRPGASSLRSVPAGSGAPEPLSPRQAPCLQMGKGDRWLRARLEAAEPAPGCQRDRKGAPEHKHGQSQRRQERAGYFEFRVYPENAVDKQSVGQGQHTGTAHAGKRG